MCIAEQTKHSESLPRPAGQLQELADYYATHDTSDTMDVGDWVDPRPMATTSLRLPTEVIEQLKAQARGHHLRYTAYVRAILERATSGQEPASRLDDITARLERIEAAVSEDQSPRRPAEH